MYIILLLYLQYNLLEVISGGRLCIRCVFHIDCLGCAKKTQTQLRAGDHQSIHCFCLLDLLQVEMCVCVPCMQLANEQPSVLRGNDRVLN